MTFLLNLGRRIFKRPPSLPIRLPTTGFQTIDSTQLIEEERFSWYSPTFYYPVRLGNVFNLRYQVVGKLGFGAHSTMDHEFVALKVCVINSPPAKREIEIFNHIKPLMSKTTHEGSLSIRTLMDHFEIANEEGVYQCLVHKPMGAGLDSLRVRCPQQRLTETLLQKTLIRLLTALDFLHTEAKVIHTDVQEGNILLRPPKYSDLQILENEELSKPIPRKIDGDRVIYLSRELGTPYYDEPNLCDFGEARFGGRTYMDDIQPYQYRAPEVLLRIPWDEKVDIWSVGVLIWDLFERKNLFRIVGEERNRNERQHHLAQMVALLGAPPKDFLERSKGDIPWKYFDREGNWKGEVEVKTDSLEQQVESLEGERKKQFLEFMRKMLRWKPEERYTAKQLLEDPWLRDIRV
ncbi:hypothetical protein FRC17_000559 [Serendipita sp. 399]|nr:hypothetical protein FRC17_000559 [Serendipita sp. 399]